MEFNIPVPWGHIAAIQRGPKNGKPVLTIHGWQDNVGSFDTLVPLLPTDWNIVCYDLAGHGLSSHYSEGPPYYLMDHVFAVRCVILHLKWERFNFICHSLGSVIGLVYACLYPDEVDHFVSLDIASPFLLSMSDQEFRRVVTAVFDQRIKFSLGGNKPKSYTREEAVKAIQNKQLGSVTYNSALILMKRGTKAVSDDQVIFTRDRNLALFLPALGQICTEQFKTLAKNMTCKLIILRTTGSHDWSTSDATFQEYVEMYKNILGSNNVQYVEVDGTHHVHLNTPELVAPHIINFIH